MRMKSATVKCHLGLTTAMVALVAGASPALAQSAAGSFELTSEIVVTATKRGAMSQQDVPFSIQAIGGADLERTNAQGLEDYIKLVPGLNTVSSGTGQSQIILRGINSTRITHAQPQAQGTTALYIDEVPISSTGFNPDLNLFDLARVEVLRGPQGTLFGASSMSGAIRLITNEPNTERLEGRVNVFGAATVDGAPSYGTKGMINLPIGENFAVRAVGYATRIGGVIDNVATGNRKNNYDKASTLGGRISVAYKKDDLKVIGTIMHNDLGTDGRPDEYVRSTRPALLANITDERQTVKFYDDHYDDRMTIYNFLLDYNFGNVTLTSSTSYFDRLYKNTLDDTFRIITLLPVSQADVPYVGFVNNTKTKTFVNETRLSSDSSGPLTWVTGFYYQKDEKSFISFTDSPGFDAALAKRGIPNSFAFGTTRPDQVFEGNKNVELKQIALFGEVTYKIFDRLEATAGLRYFDYKVNVDLQAAGISNRGRSSVVESFKEDGFNKKAQLTYRLSKNNLIYLQYSEGFRVGGVNDFIPTAAGALCAGQTYDRVYDSDTLTNIEMGVKTSSMEGRLTFNAAAYRIKWKDMQSTRFLQCGFSFTTNSGETRNQGLELEMGYRLAPGLSLQLGGSYIDSKVTKATAGFNRVGDRAPYVPELSLSSSLEYATNIFSGRGFIRSDVSHVGSSFSEFSRTSLKLPAYTVVDLTLGYQQDGWEVSLYGKNIFDKRIVTNIDPDRNQPPQYTVGRPATFGLSLTRNF